MVTALRRRIVVKRSEVANVEVTKVRLPPFVFRTEVHFQRVDRSWCRHFFVAARTSALRAALVDTGWPVTDRLG
jgi:hypothetical protein